MMAATFLAIFFVPTFFKWLVDRRLSEKRTAKEIHDEAAKHQHEIEQKPKVMDGGV